jgi:hypothetical protein
VASYHAKQTNKIANNDIFHYYKDLYSMYVSTEKTNDGGRCPNALLSQSQITDLKALLAETNEMSDNELPSNYFYNQERPPMKLCKHVMKRMLSSPELFCLDYLNDVNE